MHIRPRLPQNASTAMRSSISIRAVVPSRLSSAPLLPCVILATTMLPALLFLIVNVNWYFLGEIVNVITSLVVLS